MNKTINDIMSNAEGRYVTKAEQQQIKEYAASLEARFAAAADIESKEKEIIDATTADVMRAFPDVTKKYKDPESKSQEDLSLTLRYCTMAMIKDDQQFLDDALLSWFKTILSGLGFSGQFIKESYGALTENTKQRVDAQTWELLEPFLGRVADGLSPLREVA
ncbi:MAG: hypothetical protein AAGD10_07190 [Myxococcota bacterium]